MRINKVKNPISFKKTQPVGGDLSPVKKDLGTKVTPKFTKDLTYLTLKYKN